MGMAGYGAIRAMQESLKFNREQRKKHRKSAKELSELYPAKSRKQRRNEAQVKRDPAKIAAFRQQLELQMKRDQRRRMILLSSLVVMGLVLLWMMFI